jgi:hypothetical protein
MKIICYDRFSNQIVRFDDTNTYVRLCVDTYRKAYFCEQKSMSAGSTDQVVPGLIFQLVFVANSKKDHADNKLRIESMLNIDHLDQLTQNRRTLILNAHQVSFSF